MHAIAFALVVGLVSTTAIAQTQQQAQPQPLNRGTMLQSQSQPQQGNVSEQGGNPQMADPQHQSMTSTGNNPGQPNPQVQGGRPASQPVTAGGGQPLTTQQNQGCVVTIDKTGQHVLNGSCANVSVVVQ